MQTINRLTSKAVPLPLPNIDTDQIIPKQFLKRIERTGYGDFLFYDWRYEINSSRDPHQKPELRSDFVLNNTEYTGAEILIAEKNFGCGSSREHAAWALLQYGFRVVIAPSFADIFFSNASKNGIVLVRLSEEETETLIEHCTDRPQNRVTVDLQEQTIVDEMNFRSRFDIDPFLKYCLLNGLDDIGLTLTQADAIGDFEQSHAAVFWCRPKLIAGHKG